MYTRILVVGSILGFLNEGPKDALDLASRGFSCEEGLMAAKRAAKKALGTQQMKKTRGSSAFKFWTSMIVGLAYVSRL